MKSIYLLLFLSVLLTGTTCLGQNKNTVIVNGIPWFDDRGNIVNAHGACIVEDNGRYYLFGEWKSDKSNAFPGFSCYSSDDLVNWKFENVVLQVQPNGILGPNRVGERVKVMKCPKTGEYVMFMHADNMEYKDPYIGYATCKTINGNYTVRIVAFRARAGIVAYAADARDPASARIRTRIAGRRIREAPFPVRAAAHCRNTAAARP